MLNNEEAAILHLKFWIRDMGFDPNQAINILPNPKSMTYMGRSGWAVKTTNPPEGIFFVFRDNGDVHDSHGFFGKHGQMYTDKGQEIN